MARALSRCAAALLCISLLPAAVQAGDRLTVVELYSAQGCPRCPSAEKFLATLTEREDLLPLAFHVDYWDNRGWRDTFANPAFSRRQERYSERLGLPYVYTPQIVIDGHRHASGGQPRAVEAEIETAVAGGGGVEVTLTRLSAITLRIQLPAAALGKNTADIILVGYDERYVTQITHGDNKGMTLANHHVVRDVKSIASWNGETLDLTVPIDEEHGGTDFCAVLVQRQGQGRIIGAARLDMRMTGVDSGSGG